MTDKQIIIDVCPYQGECSVSGCKRNDDGCFVRQLFEERNRAENQIVELNKTIKAKEQECEELKNKVIRYEELFKRNLQGFDTGATASMFANHMNGVGVEILQNENIQLKAENKHLNDLLNQALKDYEKAMQTLTEIKEFFNEECIICKENYINITGEICEECKYKDILKKISEVEE